MNPSPTPLVQIGRSERPRCQNDDLPDASAHLPQPAVLLHVVQNHSRTHGLGATLIRMLGKPLERFWRKRPPVAAAQPGAQSAAKPLNLQPGEIVQVKSQAEIEQTLDPDGRHRGLSLMPEMFEHCGRTFRVYRRVQNMMLEGTGEMRRVKHTVLLEGSMCGGQPIGCDRSCFFFWREAWLRRVNGDSH